jgi:hypothetical protein
MHPGTEHVLLRGISVATWINALRFLPSILCLTLGQAGAFRTRQEFSLDGGPAGSIRVPLSSLRLQHRFVSPNQDWAHVLSFLFGLEASPGPLSHPISARRNALGQCGPSSLGNCGKAPIATHYLAYSDINACDSSNPSLSANLLTITTQPVFRFLLASTIQRISDSRH